MDTYPPVTGWSPNASVWSGTCNALQRGGFRLSDPIQHREMRSTNRARILGLIAKNKWMSAAEVSERLDIKVRDCCAMLYGLTQRRLLVKRGRQNHYQYALAPAGVAQMQS